MSGAVKNAAPLGARGKMQRDKKILKRLEHIYNELKKAERQIKRQAKQMDEGSQRCLSRETTVAKKMIVELYTLYCVCINEFNKENNAQDN